MSSNKSFFIPYGCQTISEADITAVTEALRSPYLTQGPAVPQFEKSVSAKVNAQYGIAVNSATSALHIACLSLGLGQGDRLWTSPITFVASANCGRYCGAYVDFVDIDPLTGLMSIAALKKKLIQAEKKGNLPKILVPVHLAGASCDMQEIWSLSMRYGFKVIEDASHAIGGTYQSNPVGSCKYSDITVFSFHPVKIITSAEGGMATTNQERLALKMMELRSHGLTRDLSNTVNDNLCSYEQNTLGYNYRMTDLQAALGLSQLAMLDKFVDQRNKIYMNYREYLESEVISFLQIPSGVKSSVHLSVMLLNEKSQQVSIFKILRSKGIGVQLHYYPVHLQPYYRAMGFEPGDFINSENYAKTAISLPTFPNLQESEFNYIVSSIKSLF